MSRERDEARAGLKVAQEGRRTFHRERAALEREEDERGAERRAARQWAEVEGVLPGGGEVATLVEVEEERRDFEADEARWQARIEAAEDRLRKAARRDAPGLLEDVEASTEPLQRALAALGEAAVPAFIKVLATIEPREKALAEVAALERDFRGDARTIGAQRAAIKKYLRGLLNDASQVEIAGYILFAVLQWSRQGSSPLEKTWEESGVSLLAGSALISAPSIAVNALREGRLPI